MNWTPEEKLKVILALTQRAEENLTIGRLARVWQCFDSIRMVARMDGDFLNRNEATIREDMAP